ncbi:MAG: hypothetical protein IT164_11455 [Bryobacterales bacterium]|nr:hypothetical protein [Bryobacterales bacterium]
MGSPRLILVVTLEVRNEAAADFDRFETQAAAILSKRGGRIERVIRLEGSAAPGSFCEVHLVSFPDEAAFNAYRSDPELLALKNLRERAILSTGIVRGQDVPIYGATD